MPTSHYVTCNVVSWTTVKDETGLEGSSTLVVVYTAYCALQIVRLTLPQYITGQSVRRTNE